MADTTSPKPGTYLLDFKEENPYFRSVTNIYNSSILVLQAKDYPPGTIVEIKCPPWSKKDGD